MILTKPFSPTLASSIPPFLKTQILQRVVRIEVQRTPRTGHLSKKASPTFPTSPSALHDTSTRVNAANIVTCCNLLHGPPALRGTVESVVQDSVPYFSNPDRLGTLRSFSTSGTCFTLRRRVHSTEVRSNVFRTHSPRDEGWAPGSFPSPLPSPLSPLPTPPNPLFLWPEMSDCCSWPYLN